MASTFFATEQGMGKRERKKVVNLTPFVSYLAFQQRVFCETSSQMAFPLNFAPRGSLRPQGKKREGNPNHNPNT